MDNNIGKIAKPEFIKQTSKLEAVTSYIQSFSSNIFNSFPTKSLQQTNNVSILNKEDINNLIVYSKFFWVNWSFDDEKEEKESLCLFIGYKKGFQLWNISDPEKIYELCSIYDNVDEIKAIEIIPPNSSNSLLDSDCPFLALINIKSINEEEKDPTLPTKTKSEILIYSLKTYDIVKTISFDNSIEILKIKTNESALVVSLSSNELHIISLEDFSTAMVLTDVAPSQYDNHPAIFDLGCHYLAYATTTSPDTQEKNNKIQMSIMAEKVAKEVISGVKVLGNIGLQAVKAAKNSYYQNTSSNHPNDPNSHLINEEYQNSKNNEMNYQFPVGMIKIFDIQKLLKTKDINSVIPLAHFQAQHHYMEYIQFNDSGSLLITSSCEGFTLNIWKVENHFDKKPISFTCLYKLKRGKTSAKIEDVTFSTDSRWICALSNHGTAHLYYIDPFNMEEMYKRNEVMKMYNDMPISNVNSSNYKTIRSKSINDMVNTNLITTKLPSPQHSPTLDSPPNSSNKPLPGNGSGEGVNFVSDYNTSASLDINTLKQGNYPTIAHSYHSTNSVNDEFGNLSSSFKSNSYSSSYRNSYMNYTNPNSNSLTMVGKPTQSFAISRIKFKKCFFNYVDSNQVSYVHTMNLNHKLGTDLNNTSSSSTSININDSSIPSFDGNEIIHSTLYSPVSCGKFLNKIMISSDKREPNEKQKIIIFRVTEEHRQGQLELYKCISNDIDDNSIHQDISPISTSNHNNNISPRKKSFSYSPSNSISLTNVCNPGEDILHSKLKIQKSIQWDLHRKKNWAQVKPIINTIKSMTFIKDYEKISGVTPSLTSSKAPISKVENENLIESDLTKSNSSTTTVSNLALNLQNVTLRQSSSNINKMNESMHTVNNTHSNSISNVSLSKDNNTSQNGRRKSKGSTKNKKSSIVESNSPPQESLLPSGSMSSLQSQLLNNKKLMKEKAKQNQMNNIELTTTTTNTASSSFSTPTISNHPHQSISTQDTKNLIHSQKLLSPESIKTMALKNKKWMENIEINPYDIYHTGPPIWLYSQFVLQEYVNKGGERNMNSVHVEEKDNIDLYGNPVYDSYSKATPDYEEFPRTKTITIFKKKPKPSNDYGIIPVVNGDSDLLQESLYNAINNDGIDYDNFELQKSCSELNKQELSFDDALHVYSSTSIVTTTNNKSSGDNNILYSGGGNQLILTDDDTYSFNKADPNIENYKFNDDVESVTLSSTKTKTISYDQEGHEFSSEDDFECQDGITNSNSHLQIVDEDYVIQEEDQDDTNEVIVSKISPPQNNNMNSYVSTTTTITHLYISHEPPENVLKKKK
ncbi:hypothetical protein BCR36DRAFT_334143 [Piromyces finnis]|uniref:BCAS3 WD40 domain-containing protein n=1 Tax=Piromyces finnis TaxID=1754191 RepID=A0A1Y1V2D1_9FUNG|nr:hypothetical protein BCR36DRAFT_334143 [Piromyces finnis]|eukprot:ORX44891.1 hypothetical protein BCR36DRAFT_334143 [Piromyces finnis]